MDFSLSAEQSELKRSARRFLEERCARRVRVAMESERGWDEGAWATACELGWPSLCELGWVELAVVAEEVGRTLACLPFFSSVCLGANALRAAEAGGEHLRRVEAGEALATMVTSGAIAARPGTSAGFVLSGEAAGVVNGHTADILVVPAGGPEPSLFVVDARARGVSRTRSAAFDATRPLATVALQDVEVPASARIGDGRTVRIALDRAAIALAAESLGGAEKCLEMATDYAKTRVQFDRPIGSFQAIKHHLADMFVAVETARSAVYWAAAVASSDVAELPVAAALAKSYCTEAFFRCAAACLQVHGGIGFTWEHDVHLFLRRARSSLTLLGSPSRDRETVMVEVDAWT